MLESVGVKSGRNVIYTIKTACKVQQALHSLRASSLLTLLAPTEQGFYATTSRIWEQRKLDLLQFRMPTHKRTSEGGGGGAKLLGLTMGLSLAIEAHVF